jgi:hypothetical protein
MYKIYWIKYPEHTDPKNEGYIGLTSQDINERFKEHKYNRKNKLLANRCNKENVKIICLIDGLTREDAIKIEEQYRPEKNIGWNINKGGDFPPSRKGKQNPKTLLKGENRTEKQKNASKKHSQKMKGNNSSGKRKNKIKYQSKCENCEVIFNKKQKYCSIKCAVEKRNKSVEYRKKLSEKTKKRWEDDEFKMRVSELIRKSLNV